MAVQGEGLGSALVRDALFQVASVAERVGVRALLIHAETARAADFCRRIDPAFESSPTDPLHLILLMKDLRAAIQDAAKRPRRFHDGSEPAGMTVSQCFLYGYGTCHGKLSREHYISRALLQQMARNGAVQVGGLRWQPEDTLEHIGVEALVTKVLCRKHNSLLGPLDRLAGTLFRTIDGADKEPDTIPPVTTIDGLRLERWFLKVLAGLIGGSGINNGVVPGSWCDLLAGGPWPDGWGLYIPSPVGSHVLAREFYVETLTNPANRDVKGARFRVAGAHFTLLLGKPDAPAAWGTRHPSALVFRNGAYERQLGLTWPDPGGAITYTKIGETGNRPPQWEGWKE